MPNDQRIVMIEMSVEEMGIMSIGLDVAVNHAAQVLGHDLEAATKVQQRMDRLYKGVHEALTTGVVRLDASSGRY
jgi:hypothetical protein